MISTLVVATCINLTGHWSGSCVYDSSTYGQLDGELEFNIQQPSCESITIDDASLSIPGQAEDVRDYKGEVQTTKLKAEWADETAQSLKYIYSYQAARHGKVIDDVLLDGSFKFDGSILKLEQKGHVDQDQVVIRCDLKK